MALLNILQFPDAKLRRVATPIEAVDDSTRQLIDDMVETMYAANGIGLAATQVAVTKRLLVLDVSEDRDEPMAFINPEILSSEGTEEMEEGCLSVPGFEETVTRAEQIKVRALDRNGESFELEADGLMAVCIQHEIDHLDGKLFVDYLSDLKRNRIRRKLEREARDKAKRAKRK